MVGTSRVLDSVQLGEETTPGTEAASYAVTVFGDIVNATARLDHNVRELKGVQGGATAGHKVSKLVDLTAAPVGTIQFHPNSLEFFKYIVGDYAEGGGTYTAANNSTSLPPALSIKGTVSSTEAVRMLGCYLNNVRINLTEEDILSVTADVIALKYETFAGTVSYTPPTDNPLIFSDGVFTVDGQEWDTKTINMAINPKFLQKWGVNTKTTGERQLPTSILRSGKVDIKFDGTNNIFDPTNEIEAVIGGSKPADQRSDIDYVITFTETGGDVHTLTVSGRTTTEDIGQSDSEEDYKTMNFNGMGQDFDVSGDN